MSSITRMSVSRYSPPNFHNQESLRLKVITIWHHWIFHSFIPPSSTKMVSMPVLWKLFKYKTCRFTSLFLWQLWFYWSKLYVWSSYSLRYVEVEAHRILVSAPVRLRLIGPLYLLKHGCGWSHGGLGTKIFKPLFLIYPQSKLPFLTRYGRSTFVWTHWT